MKKVLIKIPEETLLEVIRCVPQKDLERLIREVKGKVTPVRVDAHELDMLTGIISVGGDAIEDTEAIYD